MFLNLERMIKEEAPINLKYFLFVLHDIQIVQVLNLLNLDVEKVPFNASLSFEISTNDQYSETMDE